MTGKVSGKAMVAIADLSADSGGASTRFLRSGEQHAWLASMVVHGAVLAVLACIILPDPTVPHAAVLSTEFATEQLRDITLVDPAVVARSAVKQQHEQELVTLSGAAGTLGLASPLRIANVGRAPVRAPFSLPYDVLADPLELEPAGAPSGGGAGAGKRGKATGLAGNLLGRGAGMKAMLLAAYGGTDESEHAVALGLDWLARHQNRDGSWSLDQFTQVCNAQCTAPGLHSDTAGTALGVLPFLGAGHTHQTGMYRRVVERALHWLLANQAENGGLISGGGGMYSHGLAAIALCEAYVMSQDSRLRPAAEGALHFIAAAQDPRGGGWRYLPRQPGDTSVVGWQLMALASGRMGEITVPAVVARRAMLFLDSVTTDRVGGQYSYLPEEKTSKDAMTAEALLCRIYLGWPRDHRGLGAGIIWLLQNHPPDIKQRSIYYWYYATQAMHHVGGTAWKQWNGQMRDLLVGTQIKQGHQAGSWDPARPVPDTYGVVGGRVMITSLSLLTLEVYYRHLPLYDAQRVREWARRQAAESQPRTAAVDSAGGAAAERTRGSGPSAPSMRNHETHDRNPDQ